MAACGVEAVQQLAEGNFQFLHVVQKLCSSRCKQHIQAGSAGALTLTEFEQSGAAAGLMAL